MRRAPEVADENTPLLTTVASALRQRLGKDRMELWFGQNTSWRLTDTHTICIEVASEFLANCINTMFRTDLQGVITQVAGPDWGCVVTSRQKERRPVPGASSHGEHGVNYHGAKVAGNEGSATSSAPTLDVSNALNAPAKKTKNASSDVERYSTYTSDDAAGLADVAPGVDCVAADASPREGHGSEGKGAEAKGTPSLRLVRPEVKRNAAMDALDRADADVERMVELRRLNERRWDDFVLGEHNRFAHTGAQMVLERPGQISPLLIHGPNGVGKSHLAHAIAQRLRTEYRMRRVVVLTGEQFTIEYTESARGGGFANFRRKYRDVEALVIDDVHFCLGKSGTLSELRNTIDMLLRERRQVVLVADRGLNELAGLGADLYARLSGGMCCGIDPMDAATRRAVLERLCQKQQMSIQGEVLEALAAQCGGDARVLQGMVHRMAAQQRLRGGTLTADDAIRCTMDLVRASQPIVRLNDIERAVCEAFGLEEEMLRTKTKCQSISQPRMLAMFLARKYTRTALSEIGDYFGNRQHSTVISAQKKVEQWLSSDEAIALGRNKVHVREILRNLETTLQVG